MILHFCANSHFLFGMSKLSNNFFFLFWPHSPHAEVPGPGIKPVQQQ